MPKCDVCREPIILPIFKANADVTVCELCFTDAHGSDFIETHRTGDVAVGIRTDGSGPAPERPNPVEVTVTFIAGEEVND